MKNVFILGAGFTQPLKIPLISEFYNSLKMIHLKRTSILNGFLRNCFKTVVDYRDGLNEVSAKVNIDLDNIETLFSYLDMENESCGQELVKERKRMIYAIINTIDLCTQWDWVNNDDQQIPIKNMTGYDKVKYRKGNEDNCRLNIYEYFAYVIAGIIGVREYGYNRDDTIITFNYDLVLDNIFSSMDIPVNYCHDKENGNSAIKYLKLHGSANWLLCKTCDKITRHKSYPKDEIKCEKCKGKSILEPLLVPPTWNKSAYRDRINKIWQVAIDEIKKASNIFIIGYSIPPTDMYFEYLITLGLKENDIVDNIVVVDAPSCKDKSMPLIPTAGSSELDEKYKGLLNPNFTKYHYKFMPIGMYEFINDFIIEKKEEMRMGRYIGLKWK